MSTISPEGLPIFQECLGRSEREALHYIGGWARRHLRLWVLPVPERIGRAPNNEFASFTEFRKRTIFLDNPEPDSRNCNASAACLADLLESRSHRDCGGCLCHAYPGTRVKARFEESKRLTYHILVLGLHWAEPSRAVEPTPGKEAQLR